MKLPELASQRRTIKENRQQNRANPKSIVASMGCPSHTNIIDTDDITTFSCKNMSPNISPLSKCISNNNAHKYNSHLINLQSRILSMTNAARSAPKPTQRRWPRLENMARIPCLVHASWAVGPALVVGILLLLVGRAPVTAQYTGGSRAASITRRELNFPLLQKIRDILMKG